MIQFVIDLINKEDIFGIKHFDTPYGQDTLLAALGWLATSMYPFHLFLFHRPMQILKLTALAMHSVLFPRPDTNYNKTLTALERKAKRAQIKPPTTKRRAETQAPAQSDSQQANDAEESENAQEAPGPTCPSDTENNVLTTSLPNPTLHRTAADSLASNSQSHGGNAEISDSGQEQDGVRGRTAVDPPHSTSTSVPTQTASASASASTAPPPSTSLPNQDAPQPGNRASADSDSEGGGDRSLTPAPRKHPGDQILRGPYQDYKSAIVNFNGEALMRTTQQSYMVLNKDFVDKQTSKSVIKHLYEDQVRLRGAEINGKRSILWRSTIGPSTFLASVCQYMHRHGTLDVKAKDVMADPDAQAVMRYKRRTATANMAAWKEGEPAEQAILHHRLIEMSGVASGSMLLTNHEAFAVDFHQTFNPTESDHLHTPGLSYTQRYGSQQIDESPELESQYYEKVLIELLPDYLKAPASSSSTSQAQGRVLESDYNTRSELGRSGSFATALPLGLNLKTRFAGGKVRA
ncbi:hypothetical protein FA13DRAFT_1721986 [Coprinellus micaceus]|uniref:Uncharacterized protein n=1 Tax=Coprinellus micaceus TaxID=71717 RepID=A0A4Y7RSW8_COPMI|nr:hypothetical protein FA13DRAFT_1721986 [Coprinellus micaceus]